MNATEPQDDVNSRPTVKLDPSVRSKLEQIAKDDRRSMSAQVSWLIEQEFERRTPKNNDAENDAA